MIACVKVHDFLSGDVPSDQAPQPRVLVDRLWPRGVAKRDLKPEHWLKDVAPSSELRTWFDHDPERFAEFRRRYVAELDAAVQGDGDARDVDKLLELARDNESVTLLFAAKDREINHAVVLQEWVEGNLRE